MSMIEVGHDSRWMRRHWKRSMENCSLLAYAWSGVQALHTKVLIPTIYLWLQKVENNIDNRLTIELAFFCTPRQALRASLLLKVTVAILLVNGSCSLLTKQTSRGRLEITNSNSPTAAHNTADE